MRKQFIATLASATLLIGSCTAQDARDVMLPRTTSAPRPNVIVIIADDLGYADVSTYGVNRIPTPNIDRIGKQGVIFTDGYVTAPVCSPSRAGLQTGRYQQRFGFEFNNGPAARDAQQGLGLDVNEITIAKALKVADYHTGIVGKWHLGSQDQFYPTNRGYDEFVGLLTGATTYIDSSLPDVESIAADGGGEGGGKTGRRTPLNRIFEGPDKRVVENETVYLTDYFGDRSVEYVARNAKAADPYFLYAAFTAPHDPLQVTKKYYDRFPQIENRTNRIYAAMVSALDDNVGKILDAVEQSGEADNTLVVFLSDNGCAAYYPGMCACEPLRGGKLTQYEGGVRVPFLVRWPRALRGGQIYRNPISALDIFPTVMRAAGVPMPADRTYDGVDLMPYLTGRERGVPHKALMWRRQPLVSIRQGDWKMWKHLEGKYTLLYNLRDDPNEAINLASRNPTKLRELETALNQWSKDLQNPKWPSRPDVTYDVCGTPFTVPI